MRTKNEIKNHAGNISDFFSGSFDPDFIIAWRKFIDPVTLARSAGTNRFSKFHFNDETLWEKFVKQHFSYSPRIGRHETYKQIYQRLYTLALKIRTFEQSLEQQTDQSEIKHIRNTELPKLFALIIEYGFDKFDDHFPNLFSELSMRTALDPKALNNTFLHIAAAHGHSYFLHYILSKDAEVDAIDAGFFTAKSFSPSTFMQVTYWVPGTGATPLVRTAHYGSTECLKILIARRANINFTSSAFGTTPLHEAAKAGHQDCVKILLDAGAHTHIYNKEDKRALEVAKNTGCQELIKNKMRQRGESTSSSNCLIM